MRQKSDRSDYVKTKNFCITQDHVDRFNRPMPNQEKANVMSKIIDELLFANHKKDN